MEKKHIVTTGFICVIAVFAVFLSAHAVEEADSIMCDEGLVHVGDSDVDVRDNCGQPDEEHLESWVYKFGPSQPVYTVIFKDRKVVKILEAK